MHMQASSAPLERCDVLVIGGGPGGSVAAALLARKGHKVIQVEKDHHPRFHIGESLLPMNMPIYERLGVMDKLKAIGIHKPGADFEARNERGYNTYLFARALGKSPPHAYQVWRQDFDKMLFDHARELGADGREGHEVTAVEQRGARDTRVDVKTGDGKSYAIETRYLLDASGRDAFMASKLRIRKKNPQHQSAAIFGHFRHTEFRPGSDRGNISVYNFEYGWMWMIPLPNDVMSVGAVCRPDYLKQRRGRTKEFLFETLQKNTALWKRMAKAELIGDEVRVTGNYSYEATRIGGPGWMLVGDAFVFLDPVFSSGVYLATSGAEQSAAMVDEVLAHPEREARLQRKLEHRLRKGMSRFAFFIYRFNSPVMQHLFQNPRNTWQIEQGVISMLAGDLFDSWKVQLRLHLFKFIYAAYAVRHWRSFYREHRYRMAQARAQFSGGNTPVDKS